MTKFAFRELPNGTFITKLNFYNIDNKLVRAPPKQLFPSWRAKCDLECGRNYGPCTSSRIGGVDSGLTMDMSGYMDSQHPVFSLIPNRRMSALLCPALRASARFFISSSVGRMLKRPELINSYKAALEPRTLVRPSAGMAK